MPKLRSDDGSERHTEKWWRWLWTSNWEVITTPNAETEDATLNVDLKIDDGFECRNWEVMMMTLNVNLKTDDDSERRNWEVMMMTLNVKPRSDNDSERRSENRWWLRTPKLKKCWWLWMPYWRHGDGSERRNWECDSECRSKNRWRLWTPNWKATIMALNAETKKR